MNWFDRAPVLSFAFTVYVTLSSFGQATPIRIMPLGDSITYGASTPGGYRYPLYVALTNAGYNVDYVGSQNSNTNSGLGLEVNHEGHSGWRIANSAAANGLYENIYSWFEQIDGPHLVLVHIGTNDSNDPNFASAIDELDALVNRIAECQPSAEIIVTTLMKRGSPTDSKYIAITNLFNPYVSPLVDRHVAQGHKVHYLDMHAYLELSDMYDNLHPSASGYQKMANAWYPAITNIIGTNVAANIPAPIRATGLPGYQQATITFNKKVSRATATNLSNYAVSGGLSLLGASLSANQRTVTLTTSPQQKGTNYTFTITNVEDETAPAPLSVPANSQVSFTALTLRGYANNVPESSDYGLIYSLDLPAAASFDSAPVPYSTDNTSRVGGVKRVAYYLELQKSGEDLKYAWVSMDAPTNRADKLGIPTFSSGAVFQKTVSNMKVSSNVAGVSNGTFAAGGNIEFWPYNYASNNALGLAGANNAAFDFDDTCSYSQNYGCMQVHNSAAAQTIFAINHWNSNSIPDIGIGNCPQPVNGGVDWTSSANAGGYTVKTLQVLVQMDSSETTPPTAVAAQANFFRNLVTVTFSEPVAASSVESAGFTLDYGVAVYSATLLSDMRTVELATSLQPDSPALTLAITGIRDTSGNPIAAGSTIAVSFPASTLVPADIAANIPSATNYQRVYTINLPVNGSFNTNSPAYYAVNALQDLKTPFSRIAYYLELQSGSGPTQYIWTAMNAFTTDARKIGVPTNNCFFQQLVTNLEVRSNAGGIITGSAITTGNIEFWPSNYTTNNAIGIPNASLTHFDFGDGGASVTGGGYGSMQVHNCGAAATQTLFAVNNFNNNGTLCVGIGTCTNPAMSGPSLGLDWTFKDNAGAYNHRRLHVFVLPSPASDTTRPTLVRAIASRALNQVVVTFSEPLADVSAPAGIFALSSGTVSGAKLSASKREMILATSPLSAGQSYTLTVTGVRDRSSAANLILPGSTVAFTPLAPSTPSVLTNVAEAAQYELVHQLAIGNSVSWQTGCNYTFDESKFARTQPFDRIAYCLEVVTNGVYKWVYVSMDAFTADLAKIGVPTYDRGAMWLQYVSNLNIYASETVANTSVTTGIDIASGNVEFWPSNYGAGNDKSIPGASVTAFDFGDGAANATSAGHGSMQVHNYAAGNTVFAINSFGSNNRTPAIGIGNNTYFTNGSTQDPDWTFYYNAPQYTLKNLYVLVRPTWSTSAGIPPAIWSQPVPQNVYQRETNHLSVYSPDAIAFQWRRNGAVLVGATQPWLDVGSGDAGTYDVLVYGPTGYTVSQSVTVTTYAYTRPQPPCPLRIMPLGDSITYGSSTPGGYRYPLFVALTNAGYTIDYVGTQTGNGTNALPEANHEGHGGWKISDMSVGLHENIIDWLYTTDDPDIVLMHIGTNDSGNNTTFTNAIDRLDALITRIAMHRPYAHIIVTSLLKRSAPNYTTITNYFNPYVPGIVAAQQAKGRKVHFLDMHAHLELTDTYDNLHPNAAGYGKMAAAWFTAITNVVGVYGDTNAPALARAANTADLQGVTATFSKAMDPETATNIANYALSGGVTISNATLSADQRTVTLTTSSLTRDAVYTLTASNVKDYSWPTQQTIAAGSGDAFKATARGYLANVPAAERSGYKLAYSLNLPNLASYGSAMVNYTTNNAFLLCAPLRRVAYYVELQKLDGDLTYLWVSMDAFTPDAGKAGVPVFISEARFQQYVSNMNVFCNDPSVTTGSALTGNIEFWPSDYTSSNAAGIAGANPALCDFDDTRSGTAAGYGSMQIHNPGAAQTLFAFNRWGYASVNVPDLGIGNNPGGNPDWTFTTNAWSYPVRSLQVYVTLGDDTTPPTLVSAQAGSAGTLVTVAFSEPLASDSISGDRFSLDHGVSVVSATLLPDLRTVSLVTSAQPAGTALTLTVSGARDLAGGNPIASGSTITVEPAALPPEITANVGALADGYQLVYTLDIPVVGKLNSAADPYRYNQCLATGAFDRVAYYLELVTASGATQYVWAAMNPFTPYRQWLGVPTAASKALFQQYVTNLTVKSNVNGISNATFAAGGNIEFWPGNYSQGNTLSITNASASYYDYGDNRSSSGQGFGSMQVHNAGRSQVLFALNHWGTDGSALDLGIGNRPGSNDKDWTNAGNAGSYFRRTLHVLARPSAPVLASDLPAEIAANVPTAAAGYQLVCSITNIPVRGWFNTTAWAATNYVVDRRAVTAAGSFSRIAYYLELQTPTDAVPRYVWTSMDAFTSDPAKIGVPLSGTLFQQKVTNLDVFCNVPSVVTGTGIATGNIEFWPGNYDGVNALSIPDASGSTCDFGDNMTAGSHGCMQVHNYGAMQTVWAFNHFNNGSTNAIGIGNNPKWTNNDPDYTFTYNAASYTRSILHVLVLPGGDSDHTGPAIARVTAARSLDKLTVTFSETLSDRAAIDGLFSLSNGVSVLSAALLADKKTVILATSSMPAGSTNRVTVSGVRDRSSNGNLIAANASLSFTVPSLALPEVLGNVPEIGDYSLIHQLAIANSVNYIPDGPDYTVDESRYPQTNTFDRIAYCMELVGTNGIAKWVYASMKAFTPDLSKIGVPTADRGAVFQHYVSNLSIYASANVANVTTGLVASGNIEFWPTDYNAGNALGISGASATAYDFSDTRSAAGTYGSMQLHNYAAGQTIFAMSHFGGNTFKPCLGIGNQTVNHPDWTFNENADTFSTKNLYVLVRWGDTPTAGKGPEIYVQPKSQEVPAGAAVSLYVQAVGATSYQWRRNGVWIPGATQSWLQFSPASASDSGSYDVIASSASGSTASTSATLSVFPRGTVINMR